MLKRLSSQHNIKLFAVAQQVVETGTLPGSASVAGVVAPIAEA